jgi:hypothetical protein
MPRTRIEYKSRPGARSLSEYGIQEHGAGQRWTQTCPQCSHARQPHNRKLKCLSVTSGPAQLANNAIVEAGSAVWYCYNCGWTGSIGTPLPASRAPTFIKTRDDAERAAKLAAAKRGWNAAGPLIGTRGERYVRVARAISAPLEHADLRFHPACPLSPYKPDGARTCPAMLAAIRADNILIGTHTTFLRADGGGKADMKKTRLIVGAMGGGFILLGRVTDAAVIGEGIESSLSASDALGLPAIAAISAGNMAKLILPETLRRVVIAFDRDVSGVGEAAAHKLARRCIFEGRDVELAPPPESFADWNDCAQAQAHGGAYVG